LHALIHTRIRRHMHIYIQELGVRDRGGFFKASSDDVDDAFCSALLDGAFHKAILVRLVRDVSGEM